MRQHHGPEARLLLVADDTPRSARRAKRHWEESGQAAVLFPVSDKYFSPTGSRSVPPPPTLCRPVDAVIGQAPARRAIPAARRIGALVPAQRLHELETAALERLEQCQLRLSVAG